MTASLDRAVEALQRWDIRDTSTGAEIMRNPCGTYVKLDDVYRLFAALPHLGWIGRRFARAASA